MFLVKLDPLVTPKLFLPGIYLLANSAEPPKTEPFDFVCEAISSLSKTVFIEESALAKSELYLAASFSLVSLSKSIRDALLTLIDSKIAPGPTT